MVSAAHGPTSCTPRARHGKSAGGEDLAATALWDTRQGRAANCALIRPSNADGRFHFGGPCAVPSYASIDPPLRHDLDVGPHRSSGSCRDRRRRDLVWTGPLGALRSPFDRGDRGGQKNSPQAPACGPGRKADLGRRGGDTVAALNQAGVAGDCTYVFRPRAALPEWDGRDTLSCRGLNCLDRALSPNGEQYTWLEHVASISRPGRNTITACRPFNINNLAQALASLTPPPASMLRHHSGLARRAVLCQRRDAQAHD